MTLIRPIVETDLLEVLRMTHGLAAHHEDAAVLTLDDLRRDTMGQYPWLRVLVAEGQGYAALCPMAQLQFGVRGMDMHHLFVAPEARGRGVGRSLIEASLVCAKELGCRFMTVGTHPDNIAAQNTYRALGFVQRDASGPRFGMKW
jgi:ribosomal protein S18 acetylase RimI-like enzyme